MCIRDRFQELVRDIKRGLIAKVVVYKLDRISCSILDFANMMELFQQYNVESVSYTHLDVYKRQDQAHIHQIVFIQVNGKNGDDHDHHGSCHID